MVSTRVPSIGFIFQATYNRYNTKQKQISSSCACVIVNTGTVSIPGFRKPGGRKFDFFESNKFHSHSNIKELIQGIVVGACCAL